MSRFRPSHTSTLFMLVALLILVNLGFWQLRRHFEATEHRATLDERFTAAPVTELGAPEQLEWRLAELEGHFLPVEPYLMTGRFELGMVGYDLVHPFQVEDGPIILVNRGWVPRSELDDPEVQAPEGPTHIEGRLRALTDHEPTGPMAACVTTPSRIPATDRAPERWGPGMYASMAQDLGHDVFPLRLEAGAPLEDHEIKSLDTLPVTGFRPRPREIGHLEYAGNWFLIALVAVFLWAYGGVRRARLLAKSV